jgi:serine/threonine protein kinase
MAPELVSKDVDERADVYSIGTILYQMLAGRRHFEATGNIVKDADAKNS